MNLILPNKLGEIKDVSYREGKYNIPVELSNANEENRVLFIKALKDIVRSSVPGKITPPNLIYSGLSEEICPLEYDRENKKTPSRLFEFIPVVIKFKYDLNNECVYLNLRSPLNTPTGVKMSLSLFNHMLLRFSYAYKITSKTYILRTNLRACINAGIPYRYIPYNDKDELKDYKIMHVYAPYFILTKLMEHTLLSKEIKYEKSVNEKDDYWFPPTLDELDIENIMKFNQNEIKLFLKQLKFPKDIYQWGIQGWRKRDLLIGGWDQDLTWQHLFLEKNARTDRYSNFTSKEISTVVKAMKDFINNKE